MWRLRTSRPKHGDTFVCSAASQHTSHGSIYIKPRLMCIFVLFYVYIFFFKLIMKHRPKQPLRRLHTSLMWLNDDTEAREVLEHNMRTIETQFSQSLTSDAGKLCHLCFLFTNKCFKFASGGRFREWHWIELIADECLFMRKSNGAFKMFVFRSGSLQISPNCCRVRLCSWIFFVVSPLNALKYIRNPLRTVRLWEEMLL